MDVSFTKNKATAQPCRVFLGFFMPAHSYHLLLRYRSKKLIGKKAGEPEELTHLTKEVLKILLLSFRLART